MIKKVLLLAFLMISISSIAQRSQRIGYIDMEYILENVPEYNEAQSQINNKALNWQKNIDKQQKEIDDLKSELNIEKALMTKELILDKEEDIQIKTLELKKLQDSYFGVNGDLFVLRQQTVQPVQDLIYNAIQDIAIKRKYDFILDKSTDLVMLYTNKQYDVSELVIRSITQSKKVNAAKEKQQGKSTKKGINPNIVKTESDSQVTKEVEKKLDERAAKKEALKRRIEEKRALQLKKREELKKAIEAKRLKRIQEIEDAKKVKDEQTKNN